MHGISDFNSVAGHPALQNADYICRLEGPDHAFDVRVQRDLQGHGLEAAVACGDHLGIEAQAACGEQLASGFQVDPAG